MQALPAGVTCELCWTFYFLKKKTIENHDLQHRVAELALKEVFGASVLTKIVSVSSVFQGQKPKCHLENIVTVRTGYVILFYFILFLKARC